MTIAIVKKCVYNPLNIGFSGELGGLFLPILSSSYRDCLQVCPWESDRNCLEQVLLCSDIALANPEPTCGYLIPGF